MGGGGNLTPFFSQCDKTLYDTHNVLSHTPKKIYYLGLDLCRSSAVDLSSQQ